MRKGSLTRLSNGPRQIGTMLSKKLTEVVDEATRFLRAASDELHQHRPTHPMFTNWNGHAEDKVNLIAALGNSGRIVKRRDMHAQNVAASIQKGESEDAIVHLKAYQIDAWSAYDRLYDIYTRIIGGGAVTANRVLKSNIKLEELFKGKGEKLRFGGIYGNDALLIENFRWSYLVSYKVRNAIVHDGGYLFEKPLFEYDLAQQAIVLSSLVDEMFKSEPESEKVSEARSTSWRCDKDGFPWYDFNALEMLQKYNSDLDCTIGMLLHQAAAGFGAQVKYVCSIASNPLQEDGVRHPLPRL